MNVHRDRFRDADAKRGRLRSVVANDAATTRVRLLRPTSARAVTCQRCWAVLPFDHNYCPRCGLRTGAASRLRRGLLAVVGAGALLCVALGALLDNLLAGLGALLSGWW